MSDDEPWDPDDACKEAVAAYLTGDVERAFAIVEALMDEHPEHGRLRLTHGTLFLRLGRLPEATAALDLAIAFARRDDDVDGLASALGERGVCADRIGDPKAGSAFLREAVALAEEALAAKALTKIALRAQGNRLMMRLLDLSMSLTMQGELDEAEASLVKSLHIAQRTGVSGARAHVWLAQHYHRQRHDDVQAMKHLRDGLGFELERLRSLQEARRARDLPVNVDVGNVVRSQVAELRAWAPVDEASAWLARFSEMGLDVDAPPHRIETN